MWALTWWCCHSLGHHCWVVVDGDVVEGDWPGDGRALVAGRWSLLLLGPWQLCPVPVFRGGEGERERELGTETHLVVLIHGQGSVATSTYAVARASPDDLVTWLCHIVVVVRSVPVIGIGRTMRGSGCWRWRWSHWWWWWLTMERFVC